MKGDPSKMTCSTLIFAFKIFTKKYFQILDSWPTYLTLNSCLKSNQDFPGRSKNSWFRALTNFYFRFEIHFFELRSFFLCFNVIRDVEEPNTTNG